MNPIALDHLRADPVMARLIAHTGPLDLPARRRPTFESLTRAIIYQQLSGKAARAIFDRFKALFGANGFPSEKAVLRTTPETLRSAGLSRAKAGYVLDIARRTAEGRLPSLEECDALTDEEIIARLTEAKGVGRWTAEMLLIFNLSRPDVLPAHDLGVRKGFQRAYRKRRMPEPATLIQLGSRWAPFRTTASWYLWRAAELPPGISW